MNADDRLVGFSQACAILGLTREGLRSHIVAKGLLRFTHIGDRRLFLLRDVEALRAERERARSETTSRTLRAAQ